MARDTASIDCGKNEGEMQCVGYVTVMKRCEIFTRSKSWRYDGWWNWDGN